MSDDLVEKVIDAMSNCGSETVGSRMARAAIAVLRPALRAEALEEAAKVCDAIEDRLTEQWKANYKVCDYTQGASDGANDCAAAIRGLVKEPTDHGPASGSGS